MLELTLVEKRTLIYANIIEREANKKSKRPKKTLEGRSLWDIIDWMENGKELLLEVERELSETKIKLISATGSEQLALLVSKQLLESRAEILSNGGLATIEFFFDSNGEKVTASAWFIDRFNKKVRVFHFPDGRKPVYSEAETEAGLRRIGISVIRKLVPAWADIRKTPDGTIPSPYEYPIHIHASSVNHFIEGK